MIKRMKSMPGMGNIQNVLRKMGLDPKGKVDEKMMHAQMARATQAARRRDRMRERLARRKGQAAPGPMQSPAQEQMQSMDPRLRKLAESMAREESSTAPVPPVADLPTAAKKKRRKKKRTK